MRFIIWFKRMDLLLAQFCIGCIEGSMDLNTTTYKMLSLGLQFSWAAAIGESGANARGIARRSCDCIARPCYALAEWQGLARIVFAFFYSDF